MLAKIMHHCAFLIITFSSFTLCIQNGNANGNGKSVSLDKLERDSSISVEARQSTFHQSEWDTTGFAPSNGGGFQFPDKHEYNNNNPNKLSSVGYRNPYPNINQQGNPYNLALNTGEYSANSNNHNNYPYQQHPNAIASFGNREQDSPNVPNANDFYVSQHATLEPYQQFNYKNPNYQQPQRYGPHLQGPTYAGAYDNYLFNEQPNYNQMPTSPPPPRRPLPPQYAPASSYSPYQDGHLTPPYRNDPTSPSSSSSLLSSLFAGPSTHPSQDATNQFGNFAQPFGDSGGGGANPFGSLLNSIGGPFAGGNPLNMQIIRGLENIARNDDLQCVPKVLCQMLGSPTRRAQLPGFITSPVITSFIASLPSASPALIYGRAALLGLSGGEYSCARTYPKCPQNEDDILYYLNNHRGGFFKHFNEPGSEPVLDTQHNYSPPPSSQQQSQPSIFNFLTGFTSPPTTTMSTNTNQENLNSFMSDTVMNGIGSLFGNIISGFLNGQTATRRNDDDDAARQKDDSDLIESNSTTTDPSDENVEGRILNNKSNILAYVEPSSNPISFPLHSGGNDNNEAQQFESEFRFPSTSTSHQDVGSSNNDDDDADYRRGKRVNFIDSDSRPTYGSKMVFPDRTGTGNLRFDNDEYFRVGKILNRPDYNRGGYLEREQYTTTTTKRPSSYSYSQHTKTSYAENSSSNSYLDRYASSNYRFENNQPKKEDFSGNVYVANGQGVVEYYINPQGKKVYL